MTSKMELRRQLKILRQDIALERILHNFHPLTTILGTCHCVASYVAAGGEPDMLPFAHLAAESDVMTVLPWIDPSLDKPSGRAARLRFRRWTVGQPLVATQLGFQQPESNAPEHIPNLILTPLLGFDAHFNRLGQGAGHYDRAFVDFPSALRIGIAWSVQEIEDIPIDPWDMPLDAVLTEAAFRINPAGKLA